MEKLKEESLGTIVKVRRGVFFYKVFPHEVDVTSLAKHGLSRDDYKQIYFSEDPMVTNAQRLSYAQRLRMSLTFWMKLYPMQKIS